MEYFSLILFVFAQWSILLCMSRKVKSLKFQSYMITTHWGVHSCPKMDHFTCNLTWIFRYKSKIWTRVIMLQFKSLAESNVSENMPVTYSLLSYAILLVQVLFCVCVCVTSVASHIFNFAFLWENIFFSISSKTSLVIACITQRIKLTFQ